MPGLDCLSLEDCFLGKSSAPFSIWGLPSRPCSTKTPWPGPKVSGQRPLTGAGPGQTTVLSALLTLFWAQEVLQELPQPSASAFPEDG